MLKNVRITLLLFSWETLYLLIWAIGGLVLLRMSQVCYFLRQLPMIQLQLQKENYLDGTLLELFGILTIEKEMSLFYQSGQFETVHPLFWCLNPKKNSPMFIIILFTQLFPQDRYYNNYFQTLRHNSSINGKISRKFSCFD